MMWFVFSARPSGYAASSAFSSCWKNATLRQDSAVLSSVHATRWLCSTAAECLKAYQASSPPVTSNGSRCSPIEAASPFTLRTSPLATHRPHPHLAVLALRTAVAALSTAAIPVPVNLPAPIHASLASGATDSSKTTRTDDIKVDYSPVAQPAAADGPNATSALSATIDGPGPGPGPRSEVLQLMGQIRRSRSAVDLRVVLSRQAAVVDHLALVAAMTRLTQLAATTRRAADRATQRELVLELATALAGSEHLRRCGARQLGTCLHSLAELGVIPSEQLWEVLLDALCEDRSALLRAGNGVDVSVIALALARLNCSSRRAWRAVARGVEAHLSESMSPQHVANTLSALARAGAHEHRAAFSSLLARAATSDYIEALSGRNLANALWAAVRHLEALGALDSVPYDSRPTRKSGSSGSSAANEKGKERKEGEGLGLGRETRSGLAAAADSASFQQVAEFAATLARRMPDRLRQCPPTELAGVAWSLARLGWMETPAWNSLGTQLRLSAGALKPVELCTTAEALQALSSRIAAATATAAAATAHDGDQRLPSPFSESSEAKTAAAANAGPVQATSTSTSTTATATATATPVVSEIDVAPSIDPSEHLITLFATASLRMRELRPQHLARLLHVLRQCAAMQHHTAPSPSQHQSPGDNGGLCVAGRLPALPAAPPPSSIRGKPRNADPQATSQDTILAGFVREARAQVLRAPTSTFPDLGVVSSLVTTLSSCTIGEAKPASAPSDHVSAAGTSSTATAAAARPTTAASSGAGAAAPSPRAEARSATIAASAPEPASTVAVLDHLAAAAAPLVSSSANAAELRSLMAAFATAGHFNAGLCTAAAARVEALTRLVDTKSVTAGLQAPEIANPPRRRQQQKRHQQQDAAWAATVAEVADLLGALQALAKLGFHNEAALDALQPTVAALVPVMPVQALAAALGVFAVSGAPPLALASSLADTLVRRVVRQQMAECSVGAEKQWTGAAAAAAALKGPISLSDAERSALLEACRQWRASLLYPGGLTGAAYGCLNGSGDGAGIAQRDARIASKRAKLGIARLDTGVQDSGRTGFLQGFDRCSELEVSLGDSC